MKIHWIVFFSAIVVVVSSVDAAATAAATAFIECELYGVISIIT